MSSDVIHRLLLSGHRSELPNRPRIRNWSLVLNYHPLGLSSVDPIGWKLDVNSFTKFIHES